MNLNWRWLCVKPWACIYRKIIAFSFSGFFFAPQLWGAELLLSLGFVKRWTRFLAPRQVWVLSLADFVSGYICCLLAREQLYTLPHAECWYRVIRLRKLQRSVFCRTCVDTQAHSSTHAHTHRHIQHSAPQKLPSNSFISLWTDNSRFTLSGPPLRLCWW